MQKQVREGNVVEARCRFFSFFFFFSSLWMTFSCSCVHSSRNHAGGRNLVSAAARRHEEETTREPPQHRPLTFICSAEAARGFCRSAAPIWRYYLTNQYPLWGNLAGRWMIIGHSEQGGALEEEGGWGVGGLRHSGERPALQASQAETEGEVKFIRGKKDSLSCKVSTFTARSDYRDK